MQVLTVLIVDDDPCRRRALRRAIQREDRRLLTATSGAEGLRVAQRTQPDLVLTAMRLEDMRGSDLLASLEDRSIRRVLFAGFEDIGRVLAARDAGAVHRYVTEPWDCDDLRDVIEAELRLRLDACRSPEIERLQREMRELQRKNATACSLLTLTRQMAADGRIASLVRACDVLTAYRIPRKRGLGGRIRERLDAMARLLRLDEATRQRLAHAAALHRAGELALPVSLVNRCFLTLDAHERNRYAEYPVISSAFAPPDDLDLARLLASHRPDLFAPMALRDDARLLCMASVHEELEHFGLSAERSAVIERLDMPDVQEVLEATLDLERGDTWSVS